MPRAKLTTYELSVLYQFIKTKLLILYLKIEFFLHNLEKWRFLNNTQGLFIYLSISYFLALRKRNKNNLKLQIIYTYNLIKLNCSSTIVGADKNSNKHSWSVFINCINKMSCIMYILSISNWEQKQHRNW